MFPFLAFSLYDMKLNCMHIAYILWCDGEETLCVFIKTFYRNDSEYKQKTMLGSKAEQLTQ